MTGRTIGTRLALAQARAEEARTRLANTIGTLQHRASPQALAQDVAETLKARGADAVRGAVEGARRRPVRLGIALAAIGLFLARGVILRAVRQRSSPPPSKTGLRR
jgi:hypothetical protein